MSNSVLETTRLARWFVAAHVSTVACGVLTLCAFPPIVLLAFDDSAASISHGLRVLFTSVWIPAMPALGYCICRSWRAALRRRLLALDSDIRMVNIT